MQYGFQNLHYSLFDEETNTYSTPIRIPGAISLKLDPVEVKIKHSGLDGSEKHKCSILTGFSGVMTVFDINNHFLKDIFNYEVTADGDLIQKQNLNNKHFAILCESIDDKNIRNVFYNCMCTESSINFETISNSTPSNPFQIPIFCDVDKNGTIRKIVKSDSPNYIRFFQEVN